MTKKYLGLAAGLLFLAGCSNNDFTDNGANNAPEGQKRSISTITATMEGTADTRLFLSDKWLVWDAADEILVLSDEGDATNPQRFRATSVDYTTGVAQFSGNPVYGSEFYAFYPVPIDYNTLTDVAIVPWDYAAIYNEVNIDLKTPMFAKSINERMEFMQLGGMVHFRIFGTGQLQELTLRGNNGEKFYSGFNLSYASDHSLVLEPNPERGERTSITEDFATRSGDNAPVLSEKVPLDIYFSLPGGMTFENGFTISGVTHVDDDTLPVKFSMTTEKAFTVNRAEVSHFRDIKIGRFGEVEEMGWRTNFCDLSGLEVDVTPTITYDKSNVEWNFTFYTDDHADPVMMTLLTPYTGGTPELDWLDGVDIGGQSVAAKADFKFHDFENNLIFGNKVSDQAKLDINKDENGNWTLDVKNLVLNEYNGDAADQTGINLKFNGKFNFVPMPTWHFTGAAWMSGAYNHVGIDVFNENVAIVAMRFTTFNWGDGSSIPSSFQQVFLDFDIHEGGLTPAIPTDETITEFNMDIMSQGYSSAGLYIKVDDDAVMKIHKNDDGTYQISVEGVKMYPATSVDDWSPNTSVEPYISDFTFNGDLFIDYGGGE